MRYSKALMAHIMLASSIMENGGSPYSMRREKKEWDSVVPKPGHRPLSEFSVKGVKIMAYSKKDAIARYKHSKK